MKKKCLSMLLAVVMAVSLLPGTAWAADTDFVIEDGVLVEYQGSGGAVTIPDSVTAIGQAAFLYCESLTNITFGNGLKTIGNNAFRFCTGLTSVTIPNSVTTIGDYAFHGCDNLKSVIIPSSVTDIAWGAFSTHIDSAEYVPIPGLTIHGEEGSYVEQYAKENNIPFSAVNGGAPSAPTKPVDSAPSFTDVSADAWYADPVAWAVEEGITNGATNTTFAPNQDCTHAQILTFLHRAAGKPISSAKCPVTVADAYADAVNWAYGKGMIDDSFAPNAPCTRSQAVHYIWQALDEPSAKASSFTDVPADAPYAKAVDWAVEKGVTNGDGGADVFSPDKVCSRGHIVTFLYRAYVPETRLSTN